MTIAHRLLAKLEGHKVNILVTSSALIRQIRDRICDTVSSPMKLTINSQQQYKYKLQNV